MKRTWKTSVWSKDDDKEMTLPDPEVPLVYTLHYVQQGRQDWEDEVLPETMWRMKKHEKAKTNLHAEEECSEKLETMNLDPRLSKLIQKYHEVLERCSDPCLAKSWSRWTSNSSQSSEDLW